MNLFCVKSRLTAFQQMILFNFWVHVIQHVVAYQVNFVHQWKLIPISLLSDMIFTSEQRSSSSMCKMFGFWPRQTNFRDNVKTKKRFFFLWIISICWVIVSIIEIKKEKASHSKQLLISSCSCMIAISVFITYDKVCVLMHTRTT